jgi:hypothetical protein
MQRRGHSDARSAPPAGMMKVSRVMFFVLLLGAAAALCPSCTPVCATYSHSIALRPSKKKTNINQRYKDWDERKYMGKRSKVRGN